MIDAHVSLQGSYSKALLMEYSKEAQKKHIDELYVLEPTYKFQECELLYQEIRATYPCQNQWYNNITKCSIREYQNFIDEMKQEEFPIAIKFGLCVSYLPQHERFLEQLKQAYPYDVFVGNIEFIDNVAFSWNESYEMMWNKYNANFLYRRYYETMNALLTSQLFDGVAGFDAIKICQIKPSFSMDHTFHKLAKILKEKAIYVEHDTSMAYRYHHGDDGLQADFLQVCKALGVRVLRASNASVPEEVGMGF